MNPAEHDPELMTESISDVSTPSGLEKTWHRLRQALPLILLALVVVLCVRELRGFHFSAFRGAMREISLPTLAGLLLVGMGSVSAMMLYDLVLCKWLGVNLPRKLLLRYSWVANTLNNIAGAGGITGSSIRYLMLTRAGASASNAATYAGLQMLSSPLGVGVLSAWVYVTHHEALLTLPVRGWVATLCILLISLYVPAFLLITGSGPVHRRLLADLPPVTLGHRLTLLGISLFDWLLAALTLWCCLWAVGVNIDFELLLAAFSLAALAGLLSFVPSGLGVFDGVMLITLRHLAPPERVLGAVVLFRLAYYLVPALVALRLGAGLIVVHEDALVARIARRVRHHPVLGILRLPVEMISSLGTRLLAYLTFAAGVVLLISAAFPTLPERAQWVRAYIPLFAVEGSHVFGVIAGVALIGLSRGILGRMHNAYVLAQGFLLFAAGASLLKGIDVEEAIFMLIVAGLLWSEREEFTRRGYPLVSRRSLIWIGAMILAVLAFVAVGISMHHGPDAFKHWYSHWYIFGYGQEGPRFARSLIISLISLIGFLAWSWYRMPAPPLQLPSQEELIALQTFYREKGANDFSHLAFLGDKYLFYSHDHNAVIQYATIRNRMVALGDPAGLEGALEGCIREFRHFAEDYNYTPVFYQVSEDDLSLYHDNGFDLLKLGEKALVPLAQFTTTGKRNENLRWALNRAKREGLEFQVLEQPLSEDDWTQLQAISERWLQEKHAREKRFSIGYFKREYLAWSPIAVVRRQERIIAFASLMPDYGRNHELSIDLMRHDPDMPPGTMDFLFLKLIEYARSAGYAYFSLGAAPFSAVGDSPWPRRDERLIRFFYEYGSEIYGAKGLRQYKEKFNPIWRGCYLAYPHGRAVHPLLVDLTALVAGGYRQILLRPKNP